MSKKRKSFLASLDPYDWFFIVVAFAAIVYGLYRAHDLGPDSWGNVAGPLFSLASGFLFVVALRMQLREHRHALEEMEQNNTNHAALLLVAKQEKEFNVCLAAYADVKTQLIEFKRGPHHGLSGLIELARVWREHLSEGNLKAGRIHNKLIGPSYDIDSILPEIDVVIALRVKLYWVLDSVLEDSPHKKDLDQRDARFIRALILPLVKDVSTAIGGDVLSTYVDIKGLLDPQNAAKLETFGLKREGLAMCFERIERLVKVAEDRGYQPSFVV